MADVPDDGPPLLLGCAQQQLFIDPQAATCWETSLQPQIKSGLNAGSLTDRGSGESFQQAFHGPTSAEIQPSDGQPVVAWSGARR